MTQIYKQEYKNYGSGIKPFYTIKELAQKWGVSYTTVWRKIKEGSLKGTKIGKRWRIRFSDLWWYYFDTSSDFRARWWWLPFWAEDEEVKP